MDCSTHCTLTLSLSKGRGVCSYDQKVSTHASLCRDCMLEEYDRIYPLCDHIHRGCRLHGGFSPVDSCVGNLSPVQWCKRFWSLGSGYSERQSGPLRMLPLEGTNVSFIWLCQANAGAKLLGLQNYELNNPPFFMDYWASCIQNWIYSKICLLLL